MEKSWKSVVEFAPSCPRCASSNTKFCYYNNYSHSQPRYFCKGCRRYWTKGGSLRNVPVGGGCRKNRRSKSAKLRGQRERPSLTTTTCSLDSNETSYNGDPTGSRAGSDIDLAVVFANYLNQKPNQVDEEADNSNNMNAWGGNIAEEAELIEGFVSCRQEEKIEQVNPGNEFGLQNLVGGDEVEQDVFWSDSDPPVNFLWQPMAHLQEIGPLPSTNNLVNDIWSSFDSSAFELFLRS